MVSKTTQTTTTNTSSTTTNTKTTTYTPAKLPRTPYQIEPNKPSSIALSIMRHRREYESEGIMHFDRDCLYPTIQNIINKLTEQGYIVATKFVGNTDGYRNYCIDVSTKEQSGDVLFVAHYDTVDNDIPYTRKAWNSETKTYEYVTPPKTNQRLLKHVAVEDNVAYLDMSFEMNTGVGCLGADDGAGLAVMLYLMSKGVLGGYCFTTGEECGGIGAKQVLKDAKEFLGYYKMSVEIDRRGETEIIATQSSGECASEEFTNWLCDELDMGHTISHFGSYTDVSTFAEVIPENVNIAAGYINAHSKNEELNLAYIDKLAEQLLKVDWSKAPIKRKAGDYGVAYCYGYRNNRYNAYYDDWYNDDSSWTPRSTQTTSTKKAVSIADEVSDIAKIGLQDEDFLEYLLNTGISTYEELDQACEDYFGYAWEDVKLMYSNPTLFLGM